MSPKRDCIPTVKNVNILVFGWYAWCSYCMLSGSKVRRHGSFVGFSLEWVFGTSTYGLRICWMSRSRQNCFMFVWYLVYDASDMIGTAATTETAVRYQGHILHNPLSLALRVLQNHAVLTSTAIFMISYLVRIYFPPFFIVNSRISQIRGHMYSKLSSLAPTRVRTFTSIARRRQPLPSSTRVWLIAVLWIHPWILYLTIAGWHQWAKHTLLQLHFLPV